jgi:Lrp/AsnC family leucine-responsive transcriptional regulator
MNNEFEKLLDRTGRQILFTLQEEARISFSELGKKVGLTPPAAAERVRRLEEAGLISGYHACIPPEKLGLPIQAYLRLKTTPDRYPKVLAAVREMPEVMECHHVTGDDAFLLKVAAASPTHLEAIIARFSPFGETATAVILSTAVEKGLLGKPHF